MVSSSRMLKSFSLFTSFLILMVPFFAADVLALNFGSSDNIPDGISARGSLKDVSGYIQETGDTLLIEAYVETFGNLLPEQVRLEGQLPFHSCESSANMYVCKFEESDFSLWRSSLDISVSLYNYDASGAYSGSPVASKTITLKKDTTPPVVDLFEIQNVPGGIEVNFKITDSGVGVDKIEIYSRVVGSQPQIKWTGFATRQSGERYPEVFDKYETDALRIMNLDDGRQYIYLVAYDAFGNVVTSDTKFVYMNTVPPEPKNWHISKCDSSYPFDSEIKTIGSAQSENVCVFLVYEGRPPGSDWVVEGTFTNFNSRDTQEPQKISRINFPHIGCRQIFGERDLFYCKFEDYIGSASDGIFLAGDSQYAVQASFKLVDEFGNERSFSGGSKAIRVVSQPPEVSLFESPVKFDNKFYVSQDRARIRLEFQTQFDDVNVLPDDVEIDVSDIGISGKRTATRCGQNYCIWDLTGASRNGTIELTALRDEFNNIVNLNDLPSSLSKFDVIFNDETPNLVSLELSPTSGVARDGFWSVDCANDKCDVCNYNHFSSSECSVSEFWDHRVAFFEEDKYMDVIVVMSSVLGAESFVDTTTILANGLSSEPARCSSSDDYIRCVVENVGPIENSDNYFNLTISSAGNIEQVFKIPFIGYPMSGEGNIWSEIIHLEDQQTPINRQWMSLMQPRPLHVFEFIPRSNRDISIAYVDTSCLAYKDGDELMNGFIRGYSGEWWDNNYFLELTLSSGNFGGNYVTLNCTFDTYGYVDNQVHRDVRDNFLFNLTFYNSPFGKPNEEVQKEIDDIESIWGGDALQAIGRFVQITSLLQRVCSIFNAITTVILPVVSFVVDLVAGIPIPGAREGAIIATNTALDSTAYVSERFWQYIGVTCSFLTCDWCNSDVGPFRDTAICDSDNRFLHGVFSGQGAQFWTNMDSKLATMIPGERFSREYDAATNLFMDRNLDTKNSIVLAAATMCIQDVLYNIEQWRQIECRYIVCLRDLVPAGIRTVNDCKIQRGYEKCSNVAGQLWLIGGPLTMLQDLISSFYENVLSDPFALAGIGGHILCRAIFCWPATGYCGGCTILENLLDIFTKVTNFTLFFLNFGDWWEDSVMGMADGINYCEGVFEDDEWFNWGDDGE